MDTTVLILAGGSGIRLWPLSKKEKPKQFLPLGKNGTSFFKMSLSRALEITDLSHIFVLTQKEYVDLIISQAPEIPEENILCEPERKNTAPAIATAIVRIKKIFGDVTSVIMPADHFIADEAAFFHTIKKAISTAEKENSIITIGITPTKPATSFGYIKCDKEICPDVYKTEGFKEKPDFKQALEFISDKMYFWNSGIFVSKASSIVEQFKKHLPEVLINAERIVYNSDKDEEIEVYKSMPSISIDYGILEKTHDILLIKGCFGWDDIGSWDALGNLYPKDENGNTLIGNCLAVSTKASTIISNDKVVVVAGLEDISVINTEEAVLVFSRNNENVLHNLPELIETSTYKKYL